MATDRIDRPETLVVHAGPAPDPRHGAVSPPIYQSSTFSFHDAAEGAARFAGTDPGYMYTRLGNPTNRALEQCVARLEGGHDALVTASGMAAISTVFLTFLQQGDHVVATDAVYGCTRVLLEQQLSKFGIRSSWVPSERISAVKDAILPETKMVFIETPANPTLKLTDLSACSAIARRAGALLVVDNTFSSPVLQRPFNFGADIVLHSMTKYLNGHCDVVAGVIVAREASSYDRMAVMLHSLGGVMDPHQSWLVLRGIRTLAVRMQRAQQNAWRLAEWLSGHSKVKWVNYPGLPDHPQHELMMRQMAGPGAMLSFGPRGGYQAARQLIDSLQLATRAVSLGGIETLVEHPASMTHAGMPREEREAAGISDDLVRLSVGIEAVEDLKSDLDQALAHVTELVAV